MPGGKRLMWGLKVLLDLERPRPPKIFEKKTKTRDSYEFFLVGIKKGLR
jgi:hypothetical protein